MILSNNSNNIRYIYHLSNINIKESSNYIEEYEQIFLKLFTYLRQGSSSSIIFICGNIFADNKYGQNSISVCKNLLVNLTKIYPVIIIASENDKILGSLFNNINNLFVIIKNSTSYYIYNNILIGSHNKALQNVPDLNKYNTICADYLPYNLYLENPLIIENYSEYELVLLGGHSQFIYLENTHSVAYSGNLIQQGYYDKLNTQGLILWDLKNSSKFIHINNDFAYLTLSYDNTLIVPKLPFVPLFPNILVKYTNNKLECEKAIKKVFPNVTKISYIFKGKHTTKHTNINLFKNKENIISAYLKDHAKPHLLPEVNTYSNIICSKLQNYKSKEEKKIELIDLYFSNMFGYGLNNYINFDLEGLININGANANGKSSIINIILYMISGKFNVLNDVSSIMNINKKYFIGILNIKVNDDVYRIVKYGVSKMIYSKLYFISKDGVRVDISEKKIKEHESVMENLFGNYENNIKTTFVNQRDINFLDLKEFDRIDFLNQLYGIKIFDDLFDLTKEDMALDKLKSKLLRSELDKDINIHKEQKMKLISEKEKLKNEINKIYSDIINSTKKKDNTLLVTNKLNNLSELNDKLSIIDGELLRIIYLIDDYDKKIAQISKINNDLTIKKTFLDCVCKKGLSGKVLNEVLQNIEHYANAFLQNIVNIQIKFAIKDDTRTTCIEIYDLVGKKQSCNKSGFQTFIISLAIRYALLETSLIQTNFMVIDEGGFGNFDNININNVNKIFDVLREKFKSVFIITHIDIVKNECNNQIFIEKNDVSYIHGVDKDKAAIYIKNELSELKIPKTKKSIALDEQDDILFVETPLLNKVLRKPKTTI